MKHLKLFEDFNDVESIEDKLSDLFLEFEDEGWIVKVIKTKIVPDRNDWTGNFQSTQLRNVWGGEFIDYSKDVIMSKGDKKWEAVDCFVVNMSKLDHINPVDKTLSLRDTDTDNSFKVHWKNLDTNINSKVSPIKERAKRLGLELFGIHGKWFTLGKATHQDFANQPYFGWEKLIDNIVFAFIPVNR
jgi:hypothetical protein